MDNAEKFELHYYFGDSSHEIDAIIRNKCEGELLEIVLEVARALDIDAGLIKDAYREGGFRDVWRVVGKNGGLINALLAIIQIVLAVVPMLGSQNSDLEIEERKLSIEEKKLQIEKLKRELRTGGVPEGNTAIEAAESLGSSFSIIRRKSNFYSYLEDYRKVEKVGFCSLDLLDRRVSAEVTVDRSAFSKYILHTNRLRPLKDEDAVIEL